MTGLTLLYHMKPDPYTIKEIESLLLCYESESFDAQKYQFNNTKINKST